MNRDIKLKRIKQKTELESQKFVAVAIEHQSQPGKKVVTITSERNPK